MHTFSSTDTHYMQQALDLARKAKGTTFPNPSVGAIIVNNGKVVGNGATSCCGGPHAEKIACMQAGKKAHGATLYVTLEPCLHFGRTPPCTQAIIDAGIIRVVASVKDPNPLVAGKGFALLRKNGLCVEVGLLKEKAIAINEDFFYSIISKKPWISLKLAMSLDGRIADSNGNSQWITGKESRICVHELRRCHAAIAVGSETLRKDNPHLTVRHVKGQSPVRIVFSSSTNIPENSHFVKDAKKIRSIVVVSGVLKKPRPLHPPLGDLILKNFLTSPPAGDLGGVKKLPNGLEIWYTGHSDRPKSMKMFLSMAYAAGLTSIMIEGGSGLASFLLEHNLVNRIYFFYGPKIAGAGLNGLLFSSKQSIGKWRSLQNIEYKMFADDWMVTGTLLHAL